MTLQEIDLITRNATVTVPTAAKILGVSVPQGYVLVGRGELEHYKIGNRIVVLTNKIRERFRLPPMPTAEAGT